MKRFLIPILFLPAFLFGQETLVFDSISVALQFEDNAVSPSAREMLVHDLSRYFEYVSGFDLAPIDESSTNGIQQAFPNSRVELVPPDPLFQTNIQFVVGGSMTNCIVSQGLSALAEEMVSARPNWRSLTESADSFVSALDSGQVTNLPSLAQRRLYRHPDGNILQTISATDLPDEELLQVLERTVLRMTHRPICALEMRRVPLGTNEVIVVPCRRGRRCNDQEESFLFPDPIVYADGYWSFLY